MGLLLGLGGFDHVCGWVCGFGVGFGGSWEGLFFGLHEAPV